jgi:transposase
MIFVGDDWAEQHHDAFVMDEAGRRLGSRRRPEGLIGIRQLHELIAAHAEGPDQVVVGIETDRGLWVGALTAAGYQVFAINPMAVARYRDRHHVSGAKSDASDAKLLADLVRTDRHNHRSVAGDSPDAEAIRVLARAHQSLIWTRTSHTNALRNALREYYPAALAAFDDLAHGDALEVLDRAPTPQLAAHLPLTTIQSALKRGGRQRNIAARAHQIQAALRTEQLGAPPAVAAAFGATTRATVGIIAELNRQISELETALADHFETHPDADIYRSLPGLGNVLGARVLGEFGDDPNRYTDAKSRRNYAGTGIVKLLVWCGAARIGRCGSCGNVQGLPISDRGHRARGVAVSPFCAEPARRRGVDAGPRCHAHLRDDPVLVRQVRAGLCQPAAPAPTPPRRQVVRR